MEKASLQHYAGLHQESPCPTRQTPHLDDLQHVVLSDSGPWKKDPAAEDRVARAVQAAAGSSAPGVHGTSNTEQPLRRVLEVPSAAEQASVTHGVRTGSSAGSGSPGRQQQSEIYSTKQPENKPEECLLFFLCGREIKHDCLSPGNAGIPTHGSSAEIASAAGHSQP